MSLKVKKKDAKLIPMSDMQQGEFASYIVNGMEYIIFCLFVKFDGCTGQKVFVVLNSINTYCHYTDPANKFVTLINNPEFHF